MIASATDPPPRWRSWGGRALLLGGLGVALWPMLQTSPQQQTLEIELERPEEVEQVDLSWARLEAPADPLGGVSLPYQRGQAPRVIRHSPSLASGGYQLEVVVERRANPDGPRSATSHSRRVNLEGRRARIVLEERR